MIQSLVSSWLAQCIKSGRQCYQRRCHGYVDHTKPLESGTGLRTSVLSSNSQNEQRSLESLSVMLQCALHPVPEKIFAGPTFATVLFVPAARHHPVSLVVFKVLSVDSDRR